jgi:hypothetical protein
MAQRRGATVLDRRKQPAETAAGGLVQEDALDGIGGAVLERLLEGGLFDFRNR